MKIFICIVSIFLGVASAAAQDLMFDADQFGNNDLEFKQGTQTSEQYEAILGNRAKFEPLLIYNAQSALRKLSEPIGRLDILYRNLIGIRGMGTCTASIISSDLILTNYHCVPGTGDAGKARDVELVMGYYDEANQNTVRRYSVKSDPVEANKDLDYAILRVLGNPSEQYGTIKILDEDPSAGTSLTMFHHPAGYPKYVSRTGCRVAGNFQPSSDKIFHSCDTLPGSSGAPIFTEFGRGVVGLHYAGPGSTGPGKYNSAKRMVKLLEASPLLRLNKAFETPLVENSVGGGGATRIDEVLNKIMYAQDVREIAVYRSDSASSGVLGTLEAGEKVIVTGRIKRGQDGREWYQIVGPGGEIGYVFASLLTDEAPGGNDPVVSQPAFEVLEQTGTRYTTGPANVRLGPSTEYEIIIQLGGGDEVTLTGEVVGRDWYRIAMADGSVGFVSGRLLRTEKQPAQPSYVDARSTPPSTRAPIISVDPATLPDFALFRECAKCPDMVVIPNGNFTMGSPSSEPTRQTDEGPQQRVSIRRFAIARFETTWDEWDACVSAGYCNQGPVTAAGGDNSYGKGRRPVIEVDWADAGVFASYVNTNSRSGYRRPTEAEWEYAARGGTTSAYPWGSSASHGFANYGKDECCTGLASGRDQWVNTAPVGQFLDNPFGLYDMHGNVYEWVEDCYRSSLSGQNANGAAYLGGKCTGRVIRGGSWLNTPEGLRSANRNRVLADEPGYTVGFRLARTL